MSDLDLSKYEGHTPGPWEVNKLPHQTMYACDTFVEPAVAAVWANGPDAELIADAPLLLEKVRRLREELKVQREMHNVCLEIHTESESCLHAEQQLEALRQSHARLLEALLLVGRVERRGGVPYYNTSGRSLIHQDQMRELGAAVAEAGALHGE